MQTHTGQPKRLQLEQRPLLASSKGLALADIDIGEHKHL